MAQMDLARSMYATMPADWERMARPGNTQVGAHQWLDTAKAKYDTALTGYRRINDDLAASFFAATESLVDGLASETNGSLLAWPSGSNAAGAAITPPPARAGKQKD